MDNRLIELVKSIRNRSLIFMALHDTGKLPEVEDAVSTLLEALYEDAQTIATEYCAKNED